ncbi:MAG: hypothetical protein BWX80_03905 [Candidatus Hydrogenedentes bacterium ADurb.Bin101]|nr:MAG: hypothetical protein BWX80_03905 [Candidatus Hydrogenedentes bacterium ADurb.Bin101]
MMFRRRQVTVIPVGEFYGKCIFERTFVPQGQSDFHKDLAGDGGNSQFTDAQRLQGNGNGIRKVRQQNAFPGKHLFGSFHVRSFGRRHNGTGAFQIFASRLPDAQGNLTHCRGKNGRILKFQLLIPLKYFVRHALRHGTHS